MQLNPTRPNYFVCADFETYKVEVKTDAGMYLDNKVSFGGALIVCLETREKYTNHWVYTTGNLMQFFNEIKMNLTEIEPDEKWKDVVIYFHNMGSYDGDFVFKYFVNECDFKVVNQMTYHDGQKMHTINMNGKIHQFSNNAGTYYSICVGIGNTRFWLLDSYKIVPSSIKDLGAYQGMEKLDGDYSKYKHFEHIDDVPPEEMDYLRRDIEIMVQPIIDVLKRFQPKRHKLTLGAYSINQIINGLDLFEEGHAHFIKGDYADCIDNLKWRRGGFTFLNENYKNQLVEDIYVYDANSFYPSQMIHPLPIASKCFDERPEGRLYYDYIEMVELEVYSAIPKFKSGIAVLYNPYRKMSEIDREYKKDKYLKRINKKMPVAKMYFFINEFEELKKWFKFDYTIIRTKYYKMRDYLKDIVQGEYNLRLKQKAENNPAEARTKQNINTYYGKTSENPQKAYQVYIHESSDIHQAFDKWLRDKRNVRQINYTPPIDNLKYAKKMVLVNRRSKVFDVKGYKCYLAKDYEEPEITRNPVVGSYITSRARTTILMLLRKLKNKVVYGDTDSIFVKQSLDGMKFQIFDGNYISFGKSNQLMDWKREKAEWGRLFFIGKRVKNYALVGINPDDNEQKVKIASAGFKIDALEKIFISNNIFDFEKYLKLSSTTPLPQAKIKKIRTKSGINLSTYAYAYMKGLDDD